jgi:RNA polymerase sigma-54 factor
MTQGLMFRLYVVLSMVNLLKLRMGLLSYDTFFQNLYPLTMVRKYQRRIVKQRIKELIDSEKKGKPMSDEKLTKELKKLGLNIARRTVAKYREQLRIPVARLRRELQ